MHLIATGADLADSRVNAWWRIAVNAPDQMLQRWTWALSQVFVTSDDSIDEPLGLANYYDLLAKHAFGNYRDLLEAVSLSPIMGTYLSSVRNEKPDPVANIRPDENYAREIMQLFSVGPFLARRLISHLVTSNPSPAYIGRVASVFNNDGAGVRGNLLAMLRAILFDTDAVNGHVTDPTTFGMLKEPLLRQTALWRAFRAFPNSFTRTEYERAERDFGQAPMRQPSVFNFYPPDYSTTTTP